MHSMWRFSVVLYLLGCAAEATVPLTGPPTPTPLAQCQADPACGACLNATAKSMVYSAEHITQRPYQDWFMTNLTTTACALPGASRSLFGNTLAALHSTSSATTAGLYVDLCMTQLFSCFADTNCQQCLLSLTDSHMPTATALDSTSCQAVSPSVLAGFVTYNIGYCVGFPMCTYSKRQCAESVTCAPCLAALRNGQGGVAARLCSADANASAMIHNVVFWCTFSDFTGCSFMQERCALDPDCGTCLDSMSGGQSREAIVRGVTSSSCAMASNSTINSMVLSVYVTCTAAAFTSCEIAVAKCALEEFPTCGSCLNGDENLSRTSECAALIGEYFVDAKCQACHESINSINGIVFSTAVIGGISVLGCVAVLVVIFGYSHDRASLRDRILVGLIASNAVYSSANCIPLNLLGTQVKNCGQLLLSFETIRFGRAWWFAGKYAIIAFELFILGTTIVAISRGIRTLPKRVEGALHAACALTGLMAFVGFYLRCAEINRSGFNEKTQSEAFTDSFSHLRAQDDIDDDVPIVAANEEFRAGRESFNRLVQQMLVVWACFLGVALALWVYMRVSFHRFIARWRVGLADAEGTWDRELWGPQDAVVRATKRRLYELVKEAYEEIVVPLEPFVAVFVIFGIPAAMMASTYCFKNSGTQSVESSTLFESNIEETYGTCDVWCEFVLSFRSLATVAVYFSQRERRSELWDLKTLLTRFRRRIFPRNVGDSVQFRESLLEEIHTISRNSEIADDEEETNNPKRRSTSYRLMNDSDNEVSIN